MIIIPNRLCLRFSDALHLAERLRRGRRDVGDGFEMRQQRAPTGRADAGDILQRGVHARLLAQVAVMGDAEAVRLVADALNQMQRGRLAVKQNTLLLIRQEDLLQPLGKAKNRDVVADLEHGLAREPEAAAGRRQSKSDPADRQSRTGRARP